MKYLIPLVILLTACSEPTVEEIARKEVDRATLELAKEGKLAIADLSKDPESVKFRKLKVYNQYVAKDLADIPEGFGVTDILSTFCGEVNMKNSYGAYTGYKKFYHSSSGSAIVGTSGLSIINESEENWYNEKCKVDNLEEGEITDIAPK
jgi:hypothetical protein